MMGTHHPHSDAIGAEVARISPSIGVAGVSLAGIHIQDWVLILTIIYTLLMIAEKLWKWHKAWKDANAD